jgi:hypothetical protein
MMGLIGCAGDIRSAATRHLFGFFAPELVGHQGVAEGAFIFFHAFAVPLLTWILHPTR